MEPSRFPETMAGDGIVLRRWRTDDAEALQRAVNESIEHLRPWMPWVAVEPLPIDQRRALISAWEEAWQAGGDLVVGVFLEGTVVGSAGLHRRSTPSAVDIGYWTHVDFLGSGYATTTARLLTHGAFSLDAIRHVDIHHDRANQASRAIPRRLGYRFLGERPDTITAPGEMGIDCTWRMGRQRWAARPAAGPAGGERGQPGPP
ncbi:MAG: GNAT family N-acetyltransferase [Acidimicrobiales bacterium]